MRHRPTIALITSLVATIPIPAAADDNVDVTQYSLQQLLAMEITSVAKREQALRDSAAAVYVITREEIRRSGLASVPELLRLAPGVQVAQVTPHRWAISARGFNGVFSNKLLVLIDGRSVYTPLFSGVYWDDQSLDLHEIERIEVIRGPGGTLWGANAVNGVINIITRSAADTEGSRLTAGLGDHGTTTVSAAHGGRLGERGHYRVHFKDEREEGMVEYASPLPYARQRAQRAGIRVDLEPSAADRLTLSGALQRGDYGELESTTRQGVPGAATISQNQRTEGYHLLANWRRRAGETDWSLQAYLDRTERRDRNLDQRIETFDLDFQYRFPFGERQAVTWGLGYRHLEDRLIDGYTVAFDPDARSEELVSAFLQDEIVLADGLTLTLGGKFENNGYSGDEVQPSARLLWRIDQRRALWGAVSRAVRTPSRASSDLTIRPFVWPFPPFTPFTIRSNPRPLSEELVSYELGYRHEDPRGVSLELTGFYNRYDDLVSQEDDPATAYTPFPGNTLYLGVLNDNLIEADSYGLEANATWQAAPGWRLRAGYSWLKVDARAKTLGAADRAALYEGNAPEHQFQLHSYFDLSETLELDAALYRVGELSALGVDPYTRVDLRLGWRPHREWELSAGVRNLLDRRHPEFAASQTVTGEVERTVYLNATWKF